MPLNTRRLAARGILVLGPAAVLPATAALDWPELKDPPRSHVEWVAKDMRVNGLRTRTEHFDSELSASEILSFYMKAWMTPVSGEPHLRSGGGWQIVSSLRPPFQLTAQVKDKLPSGSEGIVSVADVQNVQKDWLPSDFPRSRDTTVTQVTESVDGPLRHRMISMVSSSSFTLMVNRWRDEWIRRGYHVTSEKSTSLDARPQGWLVLFDKAGGSIDMTIQANDARRKTDVLVHMTEPAPGVAP
jgi:hypothetical protein